MLHRTRRNPGFWQLQAMGWGCFYLWGVLGAIPVFIRDPMAFFVYTLTDFFIFAGSCALHPICQWLLSRSRSLLGFEAWAALLSAVVAAATSTATQYILGGYRLPDWPTFIPLYMESTFTLFMWCTLYFSVKQWQQASGERERLLQAESASREARLQALRYQLNPHFLFNSLNAVSTLVLDGNTEVATEMLSQLGELLRMSLDPAVQTEISLRQEIALAKAYLSIEQSRLGDRLDLSVAIQPETREALVPSMVLQPLVENAIKHGISASLGDAAITIRSSLHKDRLWITICNSGPHRSQRPTPNGTGIGLKNTVERLSTLYGTNHRLEMEWPETGGCTVLIDLPFRTSSSNGGDALCVR